MYKPDNVFRVFHTPIGNNRANGYDDVLNAKHKFKRLGYYKDDVENGYIDEPLVKSITSYQRDNDLQVDGYMAPGGETETHMYGDLLGLPKSTMRDESVDFKTAAAAPVIPKLFGIFKGAKAAKRAWDIWKSAPVEGRQEQLDQICEEQYEEDYAQCMLIKDKEKQRICLKSAMERRASCIQKKSTQSLPPLNK